MVSEDEMTRCWHGDVDGEGHPYVRPFCPMRQVISNVALHRLDKAEQ